jgi:rhodanese-related sulfurtransferase
MAVKRISPQETKALLESGRGFVYLDVRSTQEFDAGHVPGAKNVPLLLAGPMGMTPNPDFVRTVEKNFPKNARLICGCAMGGRSYRAAQMLQAAGFADVMDMRGGLGGETDHCGCVVAPGWATSGFPVATESDPVDQYSSLK